MVSPERNLRLIKSESQELKQEGVRELPAENIELIHERKTSNPYARTESEIRHDMNLIAEYGMSALRAIEQRRAQTIAENSVYLETPRSIDSARTVVQSALNRTLQTVESSQLSQDTQERLTEAVMKQDQLEVLAGLSESAIEDYLVDVVKVWKTIQKREAQEYQAAAAK